MKKIKNVLIAIFLGIVIVFGIAGCNVGTQNELQSTIDDLQSRIEELEEQISERDATIEDLSELIDKLEEMQDRLAEMEEQISDRDATIADLKELINQLEELELQIRDRDATIENLNERIKNLKEKIEQLEDGLAAVMGYSVAYEGNWPADRKNFVGICNSNDDLIELCTENNFGFYDESNPNYESVLGKKVREYTEDFFKSKSLVVCAFMESSYSGPLKVSSLEVIEDTLTLKIKRPFTGVASDVITWWGFIIEVDKSIVSVITNSTYLVISM